MPNFYEPCPGPFRIASSANEAAKSPVRTISPTGSDSNSLEDDTQRGKTKCQHRSQAAEATHECSGKVHTQQRARHSVAGRLCLLCRDAAKLARRSGHGGTLCWLSLPRERACWAQAKRLRSCVHACRFAQELLAHAFAPTATLLALHSSLIRPTPCPMPRPHLFFCFVS